MRILFLKESIEFRLTIKTKIWCINDWIEMFYRIIFVQMDRSYVFEINILDTLSLFEVVVCCTPHTRKEWSKESLVSSHCFRELNFSKQKILGTCDSNYRTNIFISAINDIIFSIHTSFRLNWAVQPHRSILC